MLWNFCVGKHIYNASSDDVMKFYLYETRKFVMAILHWKQRLLCDKRVGFTLDPDIEIITYLISPLVATDIQCKGRVGCIP